MSTLKKIIRVLAPPYNFPSVLDALKGIANLLYSIFSGGTCLAYQEITVTDADTEGLTIPDNAIYALILCVADSTSADLTRSVRFKQTDTADNPPTSSSGMILGDLGTVTIVGGENMRLFKAIGIEAGKSHKLIVEYYA